MIEYFKPEERHCAAMADLYREAGWISAEADTAFISAIIPTSLWLGAFDGEQLVGIARAITDGASDGYIQDVVVAHSYRLRGIGGELVTRLTTELRGQGVDWIGLIAVPGSEPFYKSLGFERLAEHTPMKLKLD